MSQTLLSASTNTTTNGDTPVYSFSICGKAKTVSTNDDGRLVFTGHKPEDIIFHTVVSSPFSQKAHTYLVYKQVPFAIKYVNPLRLMTYTVPTFELKNGRYLSESSSLGVWLEDNFPGTPSILPPHIRQQQIELEARLSKLFIEPIFQLSRPHVCKGSLALKISTLGTQCYNCWRMGWCMEDTVPGGVGVLKYIWPLAARGALFIKVIVDDIYKRTNGNSAAQNTSDAMDVFETELKLAEKEFNKTRVKGSLPRDESDVVLLSRSLTEPGIADLTTFSAITAAHRMGLHGADGYHSRPAVMSWLRKMDNIMDAKQRQGVVLKDSDGTEISYFSPPVIPAAVVRNHV